MTVSSDQAYGDPGRPTAPAAVRPRLNYDPSRAIDDKAFQSAERHTARVRRLKIVLPALALVGAGIFWGATHFVPTDLAAIAKGAGIDVTSNSVTMNKPRISGFEGTRRAYEVEAETAVQNLSDPKIVTFNTIDASIGLDDAGTAKLNAKTGVYDGNHSTLNLKDGIAISTDTGLSASVDQAAIDLAQGSMVTTVPVVIHTPEGSIKANALNVTDRGKHVTFSGGVSVTYTPSGPLTAAPGAK